jgi:hypothetical protein
MLAKSDLSDAYFKWQQANKLFTLARLQNPAKKEYELCNIFERWLINMANQHDKIVIEVNKKEAITKKMIEEMQEKNIIGIDAILSKIREIPKKENLDSISHVKDAIGIQDNNIYYKEFIAKIPERFRKHVIPYLSSEITNKIITNLAIMLITYDSITCNASSQWAIPIEVYKLFYKLGARIEGFASPINSRFYDQTLFPDASFCSLFKIDKQFGSIGNFFSLKAKQLSEKVFVLNPPFIPNIMINTAKFVIEKNIKAFIILPNWEDFDAIEMLKKVYNNYIILQKGYHVYENADTKKMIKATFDTIVFFANVDISNIDKQAIVVAWK